MATSDSTVADILDAVCEDREARELPSLQNAIASQAHLERLLGATTPAAGLKRDEILGYIRARRAEGAAANTVIRDVSTLRRAYTLAMECGVLEAMPAFPRLGEDRRAIRKGFLTEPQVAAVCRELDPDTADLVAFLFCSAWRKSEATALVWADVGPDAIRLAATKEGHTRILPVAGEIAQILERRSARGCPTDGYVFAREGKRIGDFRKRWASALKRAGLPPARIHDLRRSALKRLIEAGVDQKRAMQFSGHRTAATFHRYQITDITGLAAAAEMVAARPNMPRGGLHMSESTNHFALSTGTAGDRGRTGDLNLGKIPVKRDAARQDRETVRRSGRVVR